MVKTFVPLIIYHIWLSEIKLAISPFVLCHNAAFNVSAVFMRALREMCARERAREFTNSTPRCLVGEVNTAEKMTESTRCL